MYLLLVGYGACKGGPTTHEPVGNLSLTEDASSPNCGTCHPAAQAAWAGSHHGKAQRPVQDDSEPGLVDGRLPDGNIATSVIGVHPIAQYLVEGDRGRKQVHASTWDVDGGEWFLAHDDVRNEGDWGHWTGRGMNWNSQCAVCHVSGFDKGYEADSDSYSSRQAADGVGCISCHVDAALHLEDPEYAPREVELGTCAACHSERSQLTDKPDAEAGFQDNYLPRVPDLSMGWFATGQAHDEVFEWASFVGSKMHEAGVSCNDCHEPHSGRLVRAGDQLCTECHGASAPLDAEHSHHGSAVACVDCHMPNRTYMERHPRRDHGFLIPDPVLARETNSPDACSDCHEDMPTQRLEASWSAWYPQSHETRRAFPRALHAAREVGEPDVRVLLRELTSDSPAIRRATAAQALAPFVAMQYVGEALEAASQDANALVRLGATQALAEAVATGQLRPNTLDAAIRDSTRSVRVAAARGLTSALNPSAPEMQDYVNYLNTNLDQPGPRHDLGAWHLQHGDTARALPLLAAATQWDPGSAAFKHTYAIALSATGRRDEAKDALVEAVALDPGVASYHHALGLAYGLREPQFAQEALREAVRLAPGQAMYSRSLALLLHGASKSEQAILAARKGLAFTPDDVPLRWVLATLLRDTGKPEEAATAAGEILRRDPKHQGALDLTRQLKKGYDTRPE